jgi:hypothetical protein
MRLLFFKSVTPRPGQVVDYDGHGPHPDGGHSLLFRPRSPSPSGNLSPSPGAARMRTSAIQSIRHLASQSSTHGLYAVGTASGSQYHFEAPHAHVKTMSKLSKVPIQR